jgi:RNA polymerase sigma-70 factor (ECF subfamily)
MTTGPHEPDRDEEATSDLLERARAGDEAALNLLFERHLPPLRRWASGKLPRWARDIADTTDLVQETILETLRRLDTFEHRGDGALQAYLRQGVINRIRNELRKLATRGGRLPLESGMPDDGTSPLEAAIRQQTLDLYDAVLQQLTPDEREAVVSRVEFGLGYREIAEVLGKPSPDAARMLVVRSLVKLAQGMKNSLKDR